MKLQCDLTRQTNYAIDLLDIDIFNEEHILQWKRECFLKANEFNCDIIEQRRESEKEELLAFFQSITRGGNHQDTHGNKYEPYFTRNELVLSFDDTFDGVISRLQKCL